MHFTIEKKVFTIMPSACFGVVVARGLDNSARDSKLMTILNDSIKIAQEKFAGIKPKDHPDLQPYREAFRKMGINPNKFPCSVEALSTRVVKTGHLPDINPAVNLVNACSLKYTLPMGAHDLDAASDNIEVRFSKPGDLFVPFGEEEPEIPEEGELVYASGSTIKTRKWIWRQSEFGKVTGDSQNVFFPIDGFADYNYDAVIEARNELAASLENLLGAEVSRHYLDRAKNSVEIG